jgi:quercetin dioxygenase-like cupin family protein
LEPTIRNYRSLYRPGGSAVRLISPEDRPPTCTMDYSVVQPGGTSSRRTDPWVHQEFIIQGSGVLVCDRREYPVRPGDGFIIPANAECCLRNASPSGGLLRLVVSPIAASRGGGAAGGTAPQGAGREPVIRNLDQIDQSDGPARRVLDAAEGAVGFNMAFRSLDPGSLAPHHAHAGEHMGYMLEGTCVLVCDGQEYPVREGDAVLVPPHAGHEWRSNSPSRAWWLVFNPL